MLLLDEPSAGLAQAESETLGPLLRSLREAAGCAMVVVAHDVPLLLATCDRLVAMYLGRVIASGDTRCSSTSCSREGTGSATWARRSLRPPGHQRADQGIPPLDGHLL